MSIEKQSENYFNAVADILSQRPSNELLDCEDCEWIEKLDNVKLEVDSDHEIRKIKLGRINPENTKMKDSSYVSLSAGQHHLGAAITSNTYYDNPSFKLGPGEDLCLSCELDKCVYEDTHRAGRGLNAPTCAYKDYMVAYREEQRQLRAAKKLAKNK